MLVSPSVLARSVPEFVAYAKANPGKLAMASAGNGTPHHVSGELLKMMTRIKMLHVPYRGEAPALTDVISGQVRVVFTPTGGAIEHIRSNKLRALAVTTAARLDVLPDIPTIGESVSGYEASGWFGLVAPRNTSAAIVARLNNEVNAGLADATVKARFADMGAITFPGSPADFATLISSEIESGTRW
jgi:tripartite-type tricarboxylate transporter receptor subunit TctC